MVTDRDIQRIIEQDEAGVAALLAVYEPIEQRYFAATSNSSMHSPVIYTTSTTAPSSRQNSEEAPAT